MKTIPLTRRDLYASQSLDDAGRRSTDSDRLRITGAAPRQIGTAGCHVPGPGYASSDRTAAGSTTCDRRRTAGGAPTGTCSSDTASPPSSGQAGCSRRRTVQAARSRTCPSTTAAGRSNGQDP